MRSMSAVKGFALGSLIAFAVGAEDAAAADTAPAPTLTAGKIASDLGRHAEARALFATLVADPATPRDVACEALVRQAGVTWQHVDASEGIALLKLAHDQCASDREAMRLLVSLITGVEQDAESWRGRTEAFFLSISPGPNGPEPTITFTDEPGRDPFSASLAETPAGGRAWRGEPVSVNVRDASLMDVFRLLHEVSGLNIVVAPEIGRRTITLDVVDVPWDQMLDMVLRSQGLAASVSGNVIRIGRLEQLAAERFAGSAAELGRQQDTMGRLREVALALAAARGPAGSWPLAPRVTEVASVTAAMRSASRDLPTRDAWGNPLRYWSDGRLMRIVSAGSDSVLEHADLAGYLPTVARHPQDDLVWQDAAALTTLVTAR